METKAFVRLAILMVFANFVCSTEARAQIIKGVEEVRAPRARQIVPAAATAGAVSAASTAAPANVTPTSATETKPAAPADKFDHKVDYFARIMIRNTTYGSSLLSGNNPSAAVGTTAPNKNTVYNDFRARRLFFGINGKIEKVWSYTFVINTTQLIGNGVANADNGVTTVSSGVQEAHIGWNPTAAFNIRFGSMKTPFARENLTPAAMLATVERSISAQLMGRLFDTGAQIHGKFADNKISYGVGVFNGNGGFMNGANSDPGGANMVAARLQLDPLGEYKNGEVHQSRRTLLSFGIGGAYEKTRTGTNTGSPLPVSATQDISSFTADIGFNWSRLNLELAYYSAFSPSHQLRFGSVQGYYATAALWLIEGAWQAVVRYESYLNATAAVPRKDIVVRDDQQQLLAQVSQAADDLREKRFISIGFNFHIVEKAKLKLQTFYHYGLNRYYTTQVQATNGGSTTTSNAAEDFAHADDWFVVQLQLNI